MNPPILSLLCKIPRKYYTILTQTWILEITTFNIGSVAISSHKNYPVIKIIFELE